MKALYGLDVVVVQIEILEDRKHNRGHFSKNRRPIIVNYFRASLLRWSSSTFHSLMRGTILLIPNLFHFSAPEYFCSDTEIDSFAAEELLEDRLDGLLRVIGDGRVHEICMIIIWPGDNKNKVLTSLSETIRYHAHIVTVANE